MASVEDDDDALFAELYGLDETKNSNVTEVSVKSASQGLLSHFPEENPSQHSVNLDDSSEVYRADYEVEYQGQQDEDLGIKIVLETGNTTASDGGGAPGQPYRQPPHFVDSSKAADVNGYQPRPNRYVRPGLQSQSSNGSQTELPPRADLEAVAPNFSTTPSGPPGQSIADTKEKPQVQGIGPTGRSRSRRFMPQIQVKNVFELDIDALEDKPWRRPGEDVSDYFNYDLAEGTWKEYVREYNEAKKDAALREQHQEQIHVLDGDSMTGGPRPAPSSLPSQGRGRGRAMTGGPPPFAPAPRPYMPPNFLMARGYERPPLPVAPRPSMPWGNAGMPRAPPLPPGLPPHRPPMPFAPSMYMGADRINTQENGGRGQILPDFSEASMRNGPEEFSHKKEKSEDDHGGFSGSDYLARHESNRRGKDSQTSYTGRKGGDNSSKPRYERDSRDQGERERDHNERDRSKDRDRRRDRSRERDKERYNYDRRRSYSPSKRDRSGHRS